MESSVVSDRHAPVGEVPELALDRLRVFSAAVADDVCDRILGRCDELELGPGGLHNNETGARFYDEGIRITSVGWLKERDWIHDLLSSFADQVNADWAFDLTSTDPLQFALYRRFDFFEWHKDMLRERRGPIRKVSVVLQLSSPDQ